jgi:hypothetical protein
MNFYSVKKDLVSGYEIGLKNDSLYVPVADRDVVSFKKFKGSIEAMLNDGRIMVIPDWEKRILEESFPDKQGRGEYKIGYFLFREQSEEEKLKADFLKYNL